MNTTAKPLSPLQAVLIAGLLAGSIEVIWIAVMSPLMQLDGWEVSRQISGVFFSLPASAAATSGLLIHYLLSLLITWFFYPLWQHIARRSFGVSVLFGIALLSLLWAANFLLLLPALNPYFVTALPLSVTWMSKVLFGVAMSLSLQHSIKRQQQLIA